LAVTFIVTLAATRSVTLAARAVGMSRKSAYALKQRDPAFAFAWAAASRAGAGYKVEEVEGPPNSSSQRDNLLIFALRPHWRTGANPGKNWQGRDRS